MFSLADSNLCYLSFFMNMGPSSGGNVIILVILMQVPPPPHPLFQPGLTEETRRAIGEAAVRAAQAVNYVGAGQSACHLNFCLIMQ